MTIIAATGSRSLLLQPLAECKRIAGLVTEQIQTYDSPEIMSGMAEGFDECMASVAVRLNLPLHAVIPNYGYGQYYWGRNSKLGVDRFDRFQSYLAYAADNGSIEYVVEDVHNSSGVKVNGVHSNFLRNARMVERADAFIGYNPNNSTGTNDCVKRIKKANLPLHMVE